MKALNVLIINPTGGSPLNGPNMRSFNLAKTLKHKDIHVTILANSFFHKFHCLPKTKGALSTEYIDTVPFIWVKTKPYKRRGLKLVLNQLEFAFRSYANINKLNLSKPDVVICSSPHPFGIFTARKIADKFNAKLIFEIRDLWPEVIKELSGVWTYHPYIQMLRSTVKYAYRKSDHIVTVKRGEHTILNQKYGIPLSKIKFIPNGYNLTAEEVETFLPDAVKNELNLLQNKFTIAYVGSLSTTYDILVFIKAAHLLKYVGDIHFLIVGDGPEENSLLDYCSHHVMKNVTFLGRVPGSYIKPILRHVSIGYLGYKKAEWLKYGVSSNKIFDYMACKLPILASLETEFNPISDANCGISVNPGDENAIANAIIKLKEMTNDELRALGENGYSYLTKYHTFDFIASQYIALMNSQS